VAQYRPDAATLLRAVADVLDDVLDDVPSDKRHRVRVAAHLSRLVAREAELGPAAADDEIEALAELVGPVDDLDDATARLADRLRSGADDAFTADAWHALVEITRRDLAIAKPGHTEWTGQ
jgi:hypothetical protein